MADPSDGPDRRIHRAVVFDMDGLMIDSESVYKEAWQTAALALGHELDDAFYLTLIGRTDADGESELRGRFGPGFDLGGFRRRWADEVERRIARHGIPVKPGLFDLLERLEERGVPFAVATSSDRARTEQSLRVTGLRERVGTIVTGDEVDRGKPAPDIYLEAARRLGVPPRECVALEDSDAGVLSASSAGMTTLMVPDLGPPSPEARRAAYRTVASLVEAGPLVRVLLEV